MIKNEATMEHSNAFYKIYLVLLSIITLVSLHGKFLTNYSNVYKISVVLLYLVAFCYFFKLIFIKKIIYKKVLFLLFPFAIYTVLISFFNSINFSDIFISTSWIVSISFGYCLSQRENENLLEKNKNLNILIFFLVCVFFVFNYILNLKIEMVSSLVGVSHLFYYCLPILAYYLLKKNLKMQIIFSMIVVFFAFLSFKRASILIVCFGFFFYFLYLFVAVYKLEKKNLFKVLIGLFLLVMILFFFIEIVLNGKIIERFVYGLTHGGSGRSLIWKSTLHRFNESNLLNKLFGHGYNTVLDPSNGFDAFAHNDFLESLYDYGVFGLFYYCFIIGYILYFVFKSRLNNKELIPVFLFILSVWFFMAMFCMMIFLPVHNLSFMFFSGLLIGKLKIDNKEEIEN